MKEPKKTLPAKPAPQPPTNFYLNVVLHGPFVLFVYPDFIKAVTPKIEGHAYGAGTWLKEKPITGGIHSLVISKEQKPMQIVDESAVPIISAKSVGLDEADPDSKGHCTFILPRPESIHPRHRIPVQNIFSGKLGAVLNNKVTSLAKIHVLRYEIPHLADPRLDQCPWNSEPSFADWGHANLHIYSESPFDMGNFHAVQDFRELMRLVPGLSLGLRRTPSGSRIPESPLPGMASEEEHGLRPGSSQGPFAATPPLTCSGPSLIVMDME
jgi:hypothetical protein